MVPECRLCHASFDVVFGVSEYGMLVCVSLYISVCMLTVYNAFLMSNATAIVRVGGMVETGCDSVVNVVLCLWSVWF